MRKPPFEMAPERTAQARWPGSRRIIGPANHVWQRHVLPALALGAKNVEIRRRRPIGPWHRVTLTESEAYEALKECPPLVPSVQRAIEQHRSKSGLD